jgi:hypothetical protein
MRVDYNPDCFARQIQRMSGEVAEWLKTLPTRST